MVQCLSTRAVEDARLDDLPGSELDGGEQNQRPCHLPSKPTSFLSNVSSMAPLGGFFPVFGSSHQDRAEGSGCGQTFDRAGPAPDLHGLFSVPPHAAQSTFPTDAQSVTPCLSTSPHFGPSLRTAGLQPPHPPFSCWKTSLQITSFL